MKKDIIKRIKYEIKCLFLMLISVIVSFTSLYFFVIPADFSPSGIDGVSTILYEITGVNIGWFKIIFNVPLLIIALIMLNKRYVIYISLYSLMDSFGVILLEKINAPVFIPLGLTVETALGYRLVSAIFAGVALGVTSGIMLKMGFSTGGTDIIACIIHKKKPYIHTEKIIGIICYSVIFCSYFVYRDVTSILLSVIQIFAFEMTTSAILRGDRYAVEVKIVTKEPKAIENIILNKFCHSATVLNAVGMYSNDSYKLVLTVMTERELEDFRNIMKEYKETFIYYSGGVMVQGDFRFNEHDIRV